MGQQSNVTGGTVAELTVRNFTSKAGKSLTKHGVKLTDGREFELQGFKQIYRVGDTVSVTVEKNFNRWEMVGSGTPGLDEMPKPAGTAPRIAGAVGSGGTSSSSGGGGRVFPVPPNSGEMAIIRQNALTNAVKLVSEAGPNPIDDQVAQVFKVAYKFAAFSAGQMDVELLKQAAAVMPPSPTEE